MKVGAFSLLLITHKLGLAITHELRDSISHL
jgi:hypothetical protein